MDDQNSHDSTKRIRIRDLKIEPEAEELIASAAMQPYMNLGARRDGAQRRGSGDRKDP
jgi:hypothetical protein